MPQEITNSRVPCALRNHPHIADGQGSIARLSPSERQWAFEHWVAYNSTTICKVKSNKEGFVCPLLPCLDRFENLESCLLHLSSCSCLPDANYWCPFCWDKESFAAAKPNRNDRLRSPTSRKPSRLKRVVAFIKYLSRNSCVARWASKPFLNGITNPSENNEHYVPPENGCSSVVELEHHPVELSERRQTTGRWSAQSSTNDAPQVGFIEDFNRDLAPQVGFIEDFNRDLAPQVGFNGDFTLSNRQLTGSPLSKILDLPSPFSRIDTNSSKQMLTTAPGLLELRERVNALNQKWIKELTSHHGPDVRFFSLSTPFEKGIQSLQKFYRGTLLITFEDVFALMHIVHACASIYHGVDEPHFWHAFFLDILQWYRAIATDEDKLLFLKVAFRLWCVPGYSLAEAARYFDGFVSQPSLQELYTELKNNSSIYFNYSQNPGRQVINPSMTASFPSEIDWGMLDLFGLHNALSGGQVISLWTRYLKDSEYAKFPLSSSWPNASCATDPDEVLSIFYELQKKRPLVNTLVGEENHFDGKVSSGEQQYKSPISMKSGQSDNTLDSPATTLTCSTLIGSPGSDKYNATFTPNSTPSSSAVEHEGEFASPTSNTSLRCDICDESFRGKKEDQRSNLNRHIRTVHESNPVPCSEPECDKTFGRRDNMERHRRKSHGDPGSPNPSKRRRITGT